MRFVLLATLVVLPLGCSERSAPDQPIPTTVGGVDPDSKEPRFHFVVWDGFEWNSEKRLWSDKNTRTGIALGHVPGKAFQEVVDDFVADRMLAGNMELLTKEIRDIDGRATLLVHANRVNAPYPQEFCVVAYGTSRGCAQITALYPTKMAEDLKAQIEEALLTSRYEVPD